MLSNAVFVLIVSTNHIDRLKLRDALHYQSIDSRQVDDTDPHVLAAYLDLYLTTARPGPRMLFLDADSSSQNLPSLLELFRRHPLTRNTMILVYGGNLEQAVTDKMQSWPGVSYCSRPLDWKAIAGEVKRHCLSTSLLSDSPSVSYLPFN